MRATVLYGEGDIRVDETEKPTLSVGSRSNGKDALVKTVAACVCGSDLWPYRGVGAGSTPRLMGHELVGIVEDTAENVRAVKPGDFVIAAFNIACGECANCANGWYSNCLNGGRWGFENADGYTGGCQADYVRVPFADGTLTRVDAPVTEELIPHLLTLSDVMATGYHAAASANVKEGDTVAVIGDGAVGLCAVIAAKMLGASRIVAMSRHADRAALASEFGATDTVPERGEEAVAKLKEMFNGIGPDAVLECVGTSESLLQAMNSVRPGGHVGYVGIPHGAKDFDFAAGFWNNTHFAGGVAPVKRYLPQLLPAVLSGSIRPGLVFDLSLPLDRADDAYRAMDTRQATKVMLRP